MADENINKTAFEARNGCYDFLRKPFCMKNAGATLVYGMRKALQGHDHVEKYINDLIVKNWDAHLRVLDEQQAHLAVRPTKCLFDLKSVEFLGHLVSGNCITINKKKQKKICLSKRPTTRKEVRLFLGLANYYHDHIPSFVAIAVPWSDLTRKELLERVQGDES